MSLRCVDMYSAALGEISGASSVLLGGLEPPKFRLESELSPYFSHKYHSKCFNLSSKRDSMASSISPIVTGTCGGVIDNSDNYLLSTHEHAVCGT